MDPNAYCEEKAAQSGSSFYYSFRFLPKEQRKALIALYAFCREVDDIADNNNDSNIAAIKLTWWKQNIQDLDKNPEHPVCKALAESKKSFNLPTKYFLDIITGMEMDLDKVHYNTYEDLKIYCYHAAGAVGILTSKILGYNNEQTLEFAKELGNALQLINIIRDVGEDARMGRIYIPFEDMQSFNINEIEIIEKKYSTKFKNLMQLQADRAKQCYQNAINLLPEKDRKKQAVSLVIANIYLTLLKEIERSNFAVLEQKIALTPIRKLWIAWRTWRRENK